MDCEWCRIPMWSRNIDGQNVAGWGIPPCHGNAAAIATVSANADQRARDLTDVVKDIRAGGR